MRRLQSFVCQSCGLDLPEFLDRAHVPDWATAPDKVLSLCKMCHWAYDGGLISEETMQSHFEALKSDTSLRLYKSLAEAISHWKTGTYSAKKRMKDGPKKAGMTNRRRAAARKAVRTRQASQSRGL